MLKCQHYTQVDTNAKIIHKWLTGKTCQHYTQVVKRLKMSTCYTRG